METKSKEQNLHDNLQINLNIVEVVVIMNMMLGGIKALESEASGELYVDYSVHAPMLDMARSILMQLSSLKRSAMGIKEN